MAPGGQGTLVNICNSTVRVLPQDPAVLHSHSSSKAMGQPGVARLGWEGNSIGQARKRPHPGADGGHRDHHHRREN